MEIFPCYLHFFPWEHRSLLNINSGMPDKKHFMQVANVMVTKMVSPNPFTESTTFSFIEEGSYHLRIFDISGKQVDESVFYGKQFTYKSSKIPHGVYYYEIRACLQNESSASASFARGILIKH